MISKSTIDYGEFAEVYQQIYIDGEKSFGDAAGSVSVFHKILLDRVADAYVSVLRQTQEHGVKDKGATENLQKWLSLSLNELKSSLNEARARRIFYRRLAEAVRSSVSDVAIRDRILSSLAVVLKDKTGYQETMDEG